jgi:signal recognition particle receptor subunit beta
LQYVHATTRPENRGELVSLATDTDRTLYFDFLPVKLLQLGELTVKLQLYTVPGQVYYAATRKLVLNGADGIVFIADSQPARLEADLESFDDLNANLADQGRKLSATPHVFQWNKRDLADATPLQELERRLNLFNAPSVSTIATRGEGIFTVLERITALVVEAYRAELPATGPKPQGAPLFLDAEEVGLADAIKGLADSQPARPNSSPTKGVVAPSSPESQGTTPAPPIVAGSFSMVELWPASDREAVRITEHLLGARDPVGAVAACEDLVSRVLATGSVLLGGQPHPRDPALVASLLGLDGSRYLAFRAVARGARAKREPSPREALECYLFAVEARRALDRVSKGP